MSLRPICDIKNGEVLLVEKQSILRKLITHKARLEKLKNVDTNKHIELSKKLILKGYC
jgi:acetamidase/formamidase